MDRKEIRREGVKWFHLAHDTDKGRAPVKCNETLGFTKCEQFICYPRKCLSASPKGFSALSCLISLIVVI